MAVLILLGQCVGFNPNEEAYIVKLKGSSKWSHSWDDALDGTKDYVVFQRWKFKCSKNTNDECDGSDEDCRGFMTSIQFMLSCHFVE